MQARTNWFVKYFHVFFISRQKLMLEVKEIGQV